MESSDMSAMPRGHVVIVGGVSRRVVTGRPLLSVSRSILDGRATDVQPMAVPPSLCVAVIQSTKFKVQKD